MFNNLKDRIKDKNLIIFGEIHGTKEIPMILSQFFSEIAKEESFNVCLEIPVEFQDNIEDFFRVNKEDIKNSDGRNSLEYLKLIQNLRNLNKKYNQDIKILCIDPVANNQEEKEKGLAENILKYLSNKKTFVIMGSIHASKNIIRFQEKIIVPTGNILYKKLGNKIFNINILPSEGGFHNLGVKKITGNMDSPLNKGFDYIFKIDKVTPCSFQKKV